MVMYDSLNRRCLPPYGCDWVKAPNFERLASHSVAFDRCYAGSLPCMPARRELHTGRYNFLHRSWGPLEPFDDSMPELLKKAGIRTHLVSDHSHYWEDGGATYHTRYSSWEAIRGQEGDLWKTNLRVDISLDTVILDQNPYIRQFKQPMYQQDAVNRLYRASAESGCQREVFQKGVEFIETNHEYDNWFLQIESFDPHEPFFTYEQYLGLYDDAGALDWPPYDRVHESPETVEAMRRRYAAMVSMCDEHLGMVLDLMDRYDLWKDTMLIVNTDHGYMLGEHDWWAKNMMPCWNEVVHLPLFIWDPRCERQGEHSETLVQTIDLAPTLLSFFGQAIPKDMQGKDLAQAIRTDEAVRDYALFGYFGSQINITDGRMVYLMNAADETVPIFEYTLMPCIINNRMGAVLEHATLAPPFPFTKNMPLLKLPSSNFAYAISSAYGSLLYDLETDPLQEHPLDNEEEAKQMKAAICKLMKETDAPVEMLARFGCASQAE